MDQCEMDIDQSVLGKFEKNVNHFDQEGIWDLCFKHTSDFNSNKCDDKI